jgi:hypothetical protein
MVRGKRVAKKRAKNPERKKVIFLIILILLLIVLIFIKDYSGTYNPLTGMYNIELKADIYENEKWRIPCDENGAKDSVNEILDLGYNCKDYCSEIAYGLTLPGNNIGEVDCESSDGRIQWIAWCEDYFGFIC